MNFGDKFWSPNQRLQCSSLEELGSPWGQKTLTLHITYTNTLLMKKVSDNLTKKFLQVLKLISEDHREVLNHPLRLSD